MLALKDSNSSVFNSINLQLNNNVVIHQEQDTVPYINKIRRLIETTPDANVGSVYTEDGAYYDDFPNLGYGNISTAGQAGTVKLPITGTNQNNPVQFAEVPFSNNPLITTTGTCGTGGVASTTIQFAGGVTTATAWVGGLFTAGGVSSVIVTASNTANGTITVRDSYTLANASSYVVNNVAADTGSVVFNSAVQNTTTSNQAGATTNVVLTSNGTSTYYNSGMRKRLGYRILNSGAIQGVNGWVSANNTNYPNSGANSYFVILYIPLADVHRKYLIINMQ